MGNQGRFKWGDRLGGERTANIPVLGVRRLIRFAPTVLLFVTKQIVISVDIQTGLLKEFARPRKTWTDVPLMSF